MDAVDADIHTLSVHTAGPATDDAALTRLQGKMRNLLACFVPNPASLSTVLAESGSLITGEAALWFMLCGEECPVPTCLKVVCPRDQFHNVLRHLTQIDGNTATELGYGRDLYPSSRATALGTLSHMLVHTRKGVIEVLQSSCNSPFHPIPFQPATHMMNVLSPAFFISPYPRLTCSRISLSRSPTTCPLPRADERWLHHLRFMQVADPSEICDLSRTCYNFPACSKRVRSFADDDCLILSLGLVTPPTVYETYLDSTCTAWRLGGRPCGNRRCFLEVEPSVETELDI